jgi:hypothetical protein
MLHNNEIHFIVALDPNGWARMTRDLELIRKIFAEIRARKDVSFKQVEIPGIEGWVVIRHVEMLLNAGLVEGSISAPLGPEPLKILVKDLTMAGHDFAASLANDGVWNKLKQSYSATELAALPLKVVQSVATDFLLKWAMLKAGL